jgi:hypothetical protein
VHLRMRELARAHAPRARLRACGCCNHDSAPDSDLESKPGRDLDLPARIRLSQRDSGGVVRRTAFVSVDLRRPRSSPPRARVLYRPAATLNSARLAHCSGEPGVARRGPVQRATSPVWRSSRAKTTQTGPA